MKKWTTTGPSTCGVSLQQILDARSGPLNDIECWALIGQICVTLQENVFSFNTKTPGTFVRFPNFQINLNSLQALKFIIRCYFARPKMVRGPVSKQKQ